MRKRRSLTALRAFESVVRLGSISAAADELNVTRPAISKQVALLEEDFGFALLERTGNAIRVTEAGSELYNGLRQGFDLISATTESVARRAGFGERIRLLVCRDFASSWLAARVGTFLVANPGISVEVTAERNGSFRLDEDFDFRIFYGHDSHHHSGGLVESELCRWIDMPVCTAAFAKKYLTARRRVCDAPYLIDQNYDVWDDWCAYTGFDPGGRRSHVTTFNETTLCISVAVSGGGLTIGDSFLTLPAILSGELIVPFQTGLLSAQTYSLFTRSRQTKSRAATKFEQWLRDTVEGYQSTALKNLTDRDIRVVERNDAAKSVR